VIKLIVYGYTNVNQTITESSVKDQTFSNTLRPWLTIILALD